jgi:hypothetical protein
MRICRLWALAACMTAAGCVHGYGGCLWLAPVKHTLTGSVHFRSYPTADGVDNVPVMTLDQTAYLYSPAQSLSCLPADELQLRGISEFPESIVEGSRVSAEGKIFAAASPHDHTGFLMDVITLLPLKTPNDQTQE